MQGVLVGHAVEGELVSSADWLSGWEALKLVRKQAEAIAAQLGHDMQPWRAPTTEAGKWQCRCNACGDMASITQRSFNRAPLSGTALTFRCRPMPAYVRGARLGIA